MGCNDVANFILDKILVEGSEYRCKLYGLIGKLYMNDIKKNIDWFKKEVEPLLHGFDLKYTFFGDGDFGALNRVEFEGYNKSGYVDFWSKDWLEIHLYDFHLDQELMNVLLEPSQEEKKEKAFNDLQKYLKY